MFGGNRKLIDVLETELRFLDNGGYRNPEMWRQQFIFLDSPTCIHPAGSDRPNACQNCPLIAFVPKARRSAPVPCHHIPLTKEGFTVDSLGRWGTQEELENALRGWLVEKIAALKGSDEPETAASEEIEALCTRLAG